MIGYAKIPSLTLTACLAAALACTDVAAQNEPQTSGTRRTSEKARTSVSSTMPNRPTALLMERSMGWTSAILAVGAVVLIASKRMRRSIGADFCNPEDTPRVLSRVRLTPKQAIHVVRIKDRILLIGTGAQDTPKLLSEWAAPDERVDQDSADVGTQKSTKPALTIRPDHGNEAAA